MDLVLAEEILQSLLTKLDTVKTSNTTKLLYYKKSADYCKNYLIDLKKKSRKMDFPSLVDEVHFFKKIKPQFASRYLYFQKMYSLESSKKLCSLKQYTNVLLAELKNIDEFIIENRSFCEYFMSDAKYLDVRYFLRNDLESSLQSNDFSIERDPYFSTNKDFYVSKILANIYIKKSVERKINRDIKGFHIETNESSNLQWRSSKTDLVELIYALNNNGCLSEDISTIAKATQTLFNIDLGDYYKTWAEIRVRKKEKTKFLNRLADRLALKMEEYD